MCVLCGSLARPPCGVGGALVGPLVDGGAPLLGLPSTDRHLTIRGALSSSALRPVLGPFFLMVPCSSSKGGGWRVNLAMHSGGAQFRSPENAAGIRPAAPSVCLRLAAEASPIRRDGELGTCACTAQPLRACATTGKPATGNTATGNFFMNNHYTQSSDNNNFCVNTNETPLPPRKHEPLGRFFRLCVKANGTPLPPRKHQLLGRYFRLGCQEGGVQA